MSTIAAARILLRNVPGYCTNEVADHAVTLLLAAWRRLVPLSGRAEADPLQDAPNLVLKPHGSASPPREA